MYSHRHWDEKPAIFHFTLPSCFASPAPKSTHRRLQVFNLEHSGQWEHRPVRVDEKYQSRSRHLSRKLNLLLQGWTWSTPRIMLRFNELHSALVYHSSFLFQNSFCQFSNSNLCTKVSIAVSLLLLSFCRPYLPYQRFVITLMMEGNQERNNNKNVLQQACIIWQ